VGNIILVDEEFNTNEIITKQGNRPLFFLALSYDGLNFNCHTTPKK
jgi:hypothetical protein